LFDTTKLSYLEPITIFFVLVNEILNVPDGYFTAEFAESAEKSTLLSARYFYAETSLINDSQGENDGRSTL
jgi:hypothetical protein